MCDSTTTRLVSIPLPSLPTTPSLLSLTILPSKTCSLAMTALTEAGSSKVKNANPLDLPEGSRIMEEDATLPNWEK
jgi:hypothetical protein